MKQLSSAEYQREYKKKNPEKVKKWRENYYLKRYLKILEEMKENESATDDRTS